MDRLKQMHQLSKIDIFYQGTENEAEEEEDEGEEEEDNERKGEVWEWRISEDPDVIADIVFSMTRLLLEKVVPYEHKSLTLKKAGECLGILGKIWNLSEHSSAAATTTTTNPNVLPPNELCDKESECKLMDMEGYVDDYQYLHIEAKDMCLTDVTILPKYFVWLLSVDLSGNINNIFLS